MASSKLINKLPPVPGTLITSVNIISPGTGYKSKVVANAAYGAMSQNGSLSNMAPPTNTWNKIYDLENFNGSIDELIKYLTYLKIKYGDTKIKFITNALSEDVICAILDKTKD